MWGADEFGPGFQRVLVRASVDDPGLRDLVRRFIDAGQLGFTDPASKWAWTVLSDEDRPSMLMLETEARRVDPTDPARAGVEAILVADDVRDSEYVSKQIVEWAQRQLFAVAFEESRTAWNAGDFDAARTTMLTRLEEMSSIKLSNADRGWFFGELDLRQQRRAWVATGDDVFPTGIDPVDRRMHGGLSYGELGVAVAYSKIGKSFWLNQMVFICTRMRRKALMIPLEGGRKKTEDRLEARYTESIYRNVRRGDIAVEQLRHARREYAILKGNLVIRGFADREQWAVTMDDIRTEVRTLHKERGWDPDMIAVDYGDLILAPGRDEREKQKNAFRQLSALATMQPRRGHPGYAVWTASQAVRPDKGADEKEHVLKPRDIADCYEKVRVADAILSLNRTNKEKKDREARVYLGAYRDAEDGLLVRVRTDYDHGAFSALGEKPLPLEAA